MVNKLIFQFQSQSTASLGNWSSSQAFSLLDSK